MSWRPGDHRFQVGDRLRYDGPPEGFLPEADIGAVGTIEFDHGFDYRFRLRLDTPRSTDGAKLIRTSAISGWTREEQP